MAIINIINAPGYQQTSGILPTQRQSDQKSMPFCDVNGDGFVAPNDALLVIDYINHPIPCGSHARLNAFYYLGQALGASGNRQEEEQVYRKALALFPDDSGLLMRLATLCTAAGRLDAAAECYQIILQRGRVRPCAIHTPDIQADAALRLGKLFAQMGKRAQTVRLCSDFLKQHTGSESARIALIRLRAGNESSPEQTNDTADVMAVPAKVGQN